MTGHLSSYAQIYNLGHPGMKALVGQTVFVQEKIDGSQISFGLIDGELLIRSKGAIINPLDPGMFDKAVEAIEGVRADLKPGLIYRGEYLRKPKHNTLAYARVPLHHIALFDIEDTYNFLIPVGVQDHAALLGFESIWTIDVIVLESPDQLKPYLDNLSALGGSKIEGVVLKPVCYDIFGVDKKVVMAKYVSEAFREVHQGEWRKNNPTRSDIIDQLIMSLSTPARWEKSIQHLRDAGELEGTPRDIGKLLVAIKEDIAKEESEWIADRLMKYCLPKILRGTTAGFPEYYKEKLTQEVFQKEAS